LQIMEQEADRLTWLVNESVQIARIESGRMEVRRQPQAIGPLIREAAGRMEAALESRQLEVRASEDLPPVPADRELVLIVLRQLLDNAVKYSPPPSPVTVIATVSGGAIHISVLDRGPGIAESELGRVFERFKRGRNARSRIPGNGMGLAIAQQLLRPDHALLCISRKTSDALAAQAQQAGCRLEQWPLDLAHSREAAAMLHQWLGRPGANYASATLINNAGVIPRIAPLSHLDSEELSQALRVGLEAPMLLTAAFLAVTERWPVLRRVLNISSGLGRRPMASQAAYCAAKAGMDHYTRCLALEEALKPQGAKVCSLAPGVIDTTIMTMRIIWEA
jgi:NAD(P)-dependent dehydrogenase (short-subunit alcohol dehydrogenase family)